MDLLICHPHQMTTFLHDVSLILLAFPRCFSTVSAQAYMRSWPSCKIAAMIKGAVAAVKMSAPSGGVGRSATVFYCREFAHM